MLPGYPASGLPISSSHVQPFQSRRTASKPQSSVFLPGAVQGVGVVVVIQQACGTRVTKFRLAGHRGGPEVKALRYMLSVETKAWVDRQIRGYIQQLRTVKSPGWEHLLVCGRKAAHSREMRVNGTDNRKLYNILSSIDHAKWWYQNRLSGEGQEHSEALQI
ncbi:predicted protein [Chaetomium globosum CBS 148.51]|uniref:Uncharacterized protein n=1 Tax=Chaetomium globosum (strain ATCC 6205 / CBS 148.51 / DSM 1962 / NBRC 6347 / NRRL 1970) TaxID=306901 RepID=Q2GSX1_CHAGB|nr:uncharacterized protein CHGG_08933 [Chaetomium globosum CBS 148.51]EAQ84919.1 predicted protein [Chaetomium globosum CBS 148.51]